jgi:hypothetical protein
MLESVTIKALQVEKWEVTNQLYVMHIHVPIHVKIFNVKHTVKNVKFTLE